MHTNTERERERNTIHTQGGTHRQIRHPQREVWTHNTHTHTDQETHIETQVNTETHIETHIGQNDTNKERNRERHTNIHKWRDNTNKHIDICIHTCVLYIDVCTQIHKYRET